MRLMDQPRASARSSTSARTRRSPSSSWRARAGTDRIARREIVFVPYDEAYEEGFEDMPRRVPDTSKTMPSSGSEPDLGLDGILREVIGHAAEGMMQPLPRRFLCALVLTPVVRALARRKGIVAKPNSDRWHTKPTAMLGGVAIFAAVIAAPVMLPTSRQSRIVWPPARRCSWSVWPTTCSTSSRIRS